MSRSGYERRNRKCLIIRGSNPLPSILALGSSSLTTIGAYGASINTKRTSPSIFFASRTVGADGFETLPEEPRRAMMHINELLPLKDTCIINVFANAKRDLHSFTLNVQFFGGPRPPMVKSNSMEIRPASIFVLDRYGTERYRENRGSCPRKNLVGGPVGSNVLKHCSTAPLCGQTVM